MNEEETEPKESKAFLIKREINLEKADFALKTVGRE